MPFVSDIKGPQQPVQTPATLVTGALRRTSTIDTHPAQTGDSDVDLRARDVVAGQDGVEILGETRVRAHLSQRVIDDISSTPRDGRLARLLGSRVGPGFRSSVGKLLPGEAQRASRLNLLLDDWVGAALVSGYSVQHAAIILGIEEKLPAGTADRMAGICAGFAPEASLIGYARRNDTIPSVHGPVGAAAGRPSPGGRAASARYATVPAARLLGPAEADSANFYAHFRDSHLDGEGVETIVHEYTVAGSVDYVDAHHHLGHRGRPGAAVAGVPRRHRQCRADHAE